MWAGNSKKGPRSINGCSLPLQLYSAYTRKSFYETCNTALKTMYCCDLTVMQYYFISSYI